MTTSEKLAYQLGLYSGEDTDIVADDDYEESVEVDESWLLDVKGE